MQMPLKNNNKTHYFLLNFGAVCPLHGWIECFSELLTSGNLSLYRLYSSSCSSAILILALLVDPASSQVFLLHLDTPVEFWFLTTLS